MLTPKLRKHLEDWLAYRPVSVTGMDEAVTAALAEVERLTDEVRALERYACEATAAACQGFDGRFGNTAANIADDLRFRDEPWEAEYVAAIRKAAGLDAPAVMGSDLDTTRGDE